MKLQLPNISVWAACWSGDAVMLERTIQVMRYCQSIISAANWVIFLPYSGYSHEFNFVKIPILDWQKWSIFVNKEAPKYFGHDYAMCLHEDGFPIDTSLWTPEFLDYDYVGAPWDPKQCGLPGTTPIVGNGGFFLQSRAMMKACLECPETPAMQTTASDVYVCRTHRAWFEARGLRFAPWPLAAQFSTEQTHKTCPSFGFHGRRDSPVKYAQGWKQIQANGF